MSADVTKHEDVERIFDEANVKMGRNPEFVCACAGKSLTYTYIQNSMNPHNFTGASYPKLFLDHTMKDFEQLTTLNYLGQAYIAHVREIQQSINGNYTFKFLLFFNTNQIASSSTYEGFQD